jgi:hypothetical protein
MKKSLVLVLLALLFLVFVYAATPKTYQVTGPVLDIKGDIITVQKGNEKWEILRTADTKITGNLAVGARVTIEYKMVAATIVVK